MRRLLSPSALFAMWTLLFALPMLPLALHRPQVDRALQARQRSQMLRPTQLVGLRRSMGWTHRVATIVRFVPLSYPRFAIVFAAWPRLAGRSLDANLGRWQFAFATVAFFLAPLAGIAVLNLITLRSTTPIALLRPPPAAFSVMIFASLLAIVALWLVSLGIFAVNVAQTLSRVRADRGAA